jgi:hypothetical protein
VPNLSTITLWLDPSYVVAAVVGLLWSALDKLSIASIHHKGCLPVVLPPTLLAPTVIQIPDRRQD